MVALQCNAHLPGGTCPTPRPQGKNKPSRRQRKKQQNIIDERKPLVKARMREQGVSAEFGGKRGKAAAADEGGGGGVPEGVPRALHRLYGKTAA